MACSYANQTLTSLASNASPSSLLPFRPHSENSIEGHPYSLGSSQHVVVESATAPHKKPTTPTKFRTGEEAHSMEKRVHQFAMPSTKRHPSL